MNTSWETTTTGLSLSDSAASTSTESFYENRAAEYFDRTVTADMSPFHDRFLGFLKPGARIVDLGAGSGRDLKAMRLGGFDPIGVDGSPTLASLAEQFSGIRCLVMRFEELDLSGQFDGVWACASLLHLPKKVLPAVLRRVHSFLKKDAPFYISMILGEGEQSLPDGRFFAFYNQTELHKILENAGFAIKETWVTDDCISKERNTRWLNIIAQPSR